MLLLLAAACGSAQRPPSPSASSGPSSGPPPRTQRGLASYYATRFDGRKTASGERFDSRGMTAAHRTFSFGTRVRVTNERNGRSVVVRINDRGPYGPGRIIDVSRAAAEELGMIQAGVVPVILEVLTGATSGP